MSQILHDEIQISEKTKNDIKNNFKKIYQEKVNSVFKRATLTKSWTIISIVIAVLSLVLFITGAIIMIKNEEYSVVIPKNAKTLFIIGAVTAIISALAFYLSWIVRKIVKKQFNNTMMEQYYNIAAQDNIKELTITNITSDFTVVPQKFYPLETFNSVVYPEKVIVGNYLSQEFNLGNVLQRIEEQVSTSDGKTQTKVTYNRYLFFTTTIPQYDYTTTIKPETFLTKITQRNKVKLESSEFEKIFAVDYSDPIKLRKLFEPKVMAQMIDYSKGKKVPNIFLNQDQVTIMLPFYNLSSKNSKKGSLIYFKITSNFKSTANSLVLGIENDLTTFLLLVNWIKILNLI